MAGNPQAEAAELRRSQDRERRNANCRNKLIHSAFKPRSHLTTMISPHDDSEQESEALNVQLNRAASTPLFFRTSSGDR